MAGAGRVLLPLTVGPELRVLLLEDEVGTATPRPLPTPHRGRCEGPARV